MADCLQIETRDAVQILRLSSADNSNRLTRDCVLALTETVCELARRPRPLVITGNQHFFSAGADLNEIAALTGPQAFAFSRMGQNLMNAIENFPAPVVAAVPGYCIGGGLDLALACAARIAAPNAIFGHRGAALGLITGWGGTQRLRKLVGKARAIQMFVTAEKVHAQEALRIGLINAINADPVAAAITIFASAREQSQRSNPMPDFT